MLETLHNLEYELKRFLELWPRTVPEGSFLQWKVLKFPEKVNVRLDRTLTMRYYCARSSHFSTLDGTGDKELY